MKSEDPFGLRPIWDASIAIYKEVARICIKHNLRFYATDGTALGAVRHKGFIPWDDDFDISMPRPDYEKFKALAETELPSHLKFVDFRNAPDIHCLFGKVQDVRRDFVEGLERTVGHTLSNGVFIDIFPIEGCPASGVGRFMDRIRYYLVAQSLFWRNREWKTRTWKRKAFSLLGFFCTFLFPRLKTWSDYLEYWERTARKHDFDRSAYTCRFCESRTPYRRAPIRREVWGNPVEHEFEDMHIMLPTDVDAYLRSEFYQWDYIQLPPECDRHPTHTFEDHFPWWLGPTR